MKNFERQRREQLLCLVGSTYSDRLWCLMELFTFVRVGGRRDDIDVQQA